jgi:circadian clock protein KaiB
MQSKNKKIPGRGKKSAVLDSKIAFEKLLKNADTIQHYQLRLYITGTTPRSAQAVANIRSLCEEYLAGHHDLEVIDIYQQPTEAAKEQIIAAPTLVKQLPNPPRRLIGDLSDRGKVIIGLNLTGKNLMAKKPAGKTKWAKI